MTNLTDLLDPQGDASRVLIRYANRLLVVEHRDHHELLSLDDNGATWSDNPTRLWDWHREVAAGHAAVIAGSDAAANEIRAATGYLRRARTQRGFERMVGAVGPAFLHMQDSEDIPPGLTVCQGGGLDLDPLYLGCANGVVDLNVGRLLPPEEGRRQLISRNTGVSFDPEARDGSVDDLLTLLSEPESCHLLAALGHALRGGSPGRWYLLCEEPDSGKSTLLRIIADALGIVQSGGYAFFPPDRLMIYGRHTSTTRFANQLREFTRGRVALVDGLPVIGANFNLGLVKTLISEGHLGRWDEHNLDGVPTTVTATIFQALRPEEIDKLDLSDPALVDRTHVLSCLPLHGRTIGDGPFLDPSTDQARQAMLALLVQHAAANREPPDGPASVTRLLRERHRASIGSVGRWLVDHLQVTGDGDEIIFADEIMAALAEDIPPDAQDQFQGRTRREILHLARDLIQGFPTARRLKRGERLLSAYPGLRLLTTAPADAELETHTADSEMGRLIVDVALEEHIPAPCVCICCGRGTEDQALKKCWECATALVMGRQAAEEVVDPLDIWESAVHGSEAMWTDAAAEFQRRLDAGEVPPAEAMPYQPGRIWSAAQWAADSAALDAYLAQPEWISEVAVHPVTLPALAAWIAAGHCPIQALAQSRSELDGLCSDDLGHPRWAWCPGDAPVTLMAVPVDADPMTVSDLLSLADQYGNMFPDAPKPDPLGPLVRAYLEARGGSPP